MSKQGPKDPNETAFRILREATGDAPKTLPADKSSSGVERGVARARKLTDEQRQEIAKKAARARWSKKTA